MHLAIACFVIGLCAMAIIFAVIFRSPQQQWQNIQKSFFKKQVPVTDTIKISNKVVKTAYIPILMYHHVGDLPKTYNKIREDLTVSTNSFNEQVAWLSEQGYSSITLKDLLLYTQNKYTMPAKPVIFTFDDGYTDVFENAVPILKNYGFVGSFGIITQFPGLDTGDNQYATWDQIKLAKQQGMEIISHTQNHFDGTNPDYSEKFILENLSGSQEDLKNHIGNTEPILIYPYGHYNNIYLHQAKKAGFVMGITTHEGKKIYSNNLMEIPRIRVHGNEPITTFKKLVQN